jgi:hypothetical protein
MMRSWPHDHLEAGHDRAARVAFLHLQCGPQAGRVEAVAAKKAQEDA